MAIVPYSKQNEFDLVHTGQDCRGWAAVDQAGNPLGRISEMLIDTDRGMIDSVIIDNHTRVPAPDIALREGRVVVRGVVHNEQYEQTRQAASAARSQNAVGASEANVNQTYETMRREPTFVPGVTREANEAEISLPVIEEELRLGKRTIEAGGARVHTNLRETPIEQSVALREEQVRVERTPVNRPATAADFQTFQEGTIEITEMAEVPVVGKEARVVEEVRIGKEIVEREETVQTTLHKTEVEVERFDGDAVNDDATRVRTARSRD
jgi:uncharacterized protein (TIGR02271 family)